METALRVSEKKLHEAIQTLCLHTPNLPFVQTKVMQASFISILAISISKVSGLHHVLTWIFDYFQTPPASGPQ